jgi:hypothetical protein
VTRREVLATLAALIAAPGCALKARQQPGLASIQGHVTTTGLRFGKTTEKNPTGQYPTTSVVPGQFVHLSILDFSGRAPVEVRLKSILTSDHGYFEFNNLPGGYYRIAVGAGTNPVWVPITKNKPHYLRIKL